jgi:hypothetical protein
VKEQEELLSMIEEKQKNNIYRLINIIGNDTKKIPAPRYATLATAIGSTIGGYVANQ